MNRTLPDNPYVIVPDSRNAPLPVISTSDSKAAASPPLGSTAAWTPVRPKLTRNVWPGAVVLAWSLPSPVGLAVPVN